MEADLQIHCGVDYRDRWRRDAAGLRRLTLRRMYVLIRQMPHDSALAQLDDSWSPWRLEHHLLDDLRIVAEGAAGKKNPKPHATRPKPRRKKAALADPARQQRLVAARRRAEQRRQDIAAGEIT